MKNILGIFKNFSFLFFLNGSLLFTVLYFFIESQYETKLFNAIARKITRDTVARSNSDTFFSHSIIMTNYLVSNRTIIFGDEKIGGLKANLFHSSTVDLMTGDGFCGSASVVLARILKANNYEVRIAQMKVGNTWGGHIVTEVKKGLGWIVLDPLFNIYFKKPDGHFASFKEVEANWDYYKKEAPSNYPPEYNYADVRYTNWEKYGFAGQAVYRTLTMILGKEKTDGICLRSYLLRNYYLLFWASLLLWIICTGWMVWLKVRGGRMWK